MRYVPAPERFARFVQVEPNGCWLWTGYRDRGGYGRFQETPRHSVAAHRFAWVQANGPIPPGLQPDHLCRVRHCVNPAHMELVTLQENIRRGVAGKRGGERQRAKTHCPAGHEYAGANLYVAPDGSRRCRVCRRLGMRRHR